MNLGILNVLLAYSDDIVLIGNSIDDVIQTTRKLLNSSETMGLQVNKNKPKYMRISRTKAEYSYLKVDNLTFEKLNELIYLLVNINKSNIMQDDTSDTSDYANANERYFSILNLIKSKNLTYESKNILYTNYLRLILTYGYEILSTTKGNQQNLIIFERKILRKMYDTLYNIEIKHYNKRPNILLFTRSKIFVWSEHVWRADGQIIRQTLVAEMRGNRPLCRPKTRIKDSDMRDLKILQERYQIVK